MASYKIRVMGDESTVARAAAERVIQAAASAVETTGRFHLALSGGRTPRPVYELLAADGNLGRIQWAAVHIYFTDERQVPPTHADSNFRLASDTLLDLVPIPPQNIHRMKGELEPEAAAAEYGRMLSETFSDGGLDLAILGVGEDGHTASLFPRHPALQERQHRCVAARIDQLGAWRITLTAPFLNRSREVMVLVTGENKAGIVQQVLEGEPDPLRLPIQLIDPPEGRITWILDSAAAGMV
jgi:6-phosphogluconolactonase